MLSVNIRSYHQSSEAFFKTNVSVVISHLFVHILVGVHREKDSSESDRSELNRHLFSLPRDVLVTVC